MENISGKSRASFRWMLSCATIGLLVSIPTMLRAADLGTQGMQLGTAPPEIMPFRCDSLDPKVCFDIYGRILNSTPWLFYGTVGGHGLPFSNEGWLSGWTAGTGVEPRLGTPIPFVPSFK
jgi:hypothetical protein